MDMIRYPVLNVHVLGIDVREPSPPEPIFPVPGPPTEEAMDDWIGEWTRLCVDGRKEGSIASDVENIIRAMAFQLGYDVVLNYEDCVPTIRRQPALPIRTTPPAFDWSQRAVPISEEAARQATAYQQPRIPTVPFGGLFSGAGGMAYTGPTT